MTFVLIFVSIAI